MFSTRVVASTIAGASLIHSRTWAVDLLCRLFFALAHWLVTRVEFAAAELALKTQVILTLSSYIPSIAYCIYLLCWLGVAVFYLSRSIVHWATVVARETAKLWVGIHSEIIQIFLQALCSNSLAESAQKHPSIHLPDLSALTWQSVMESGSFVLISREREWDEVLLVTHGEGTEWLCYSTNGDGGRFIWTLIKMTLGNFRVVEGRDVARSPPPGIASVAVNWMCDPNNVANKWAPSAAQLVNLVSEGKVIMDIVKADSTSAARHVAGSPAELAELVPSRGPLPPAQAPADGASPPPLPCPAPSLGPADTSDSLELKKLAEVVNALKSELADSKTSKKKSKKKKSKKSRSRSAERKKKKKSRRRSSSSSSSSSASHRSSSSSSSFVRWKMDGKSKDVSAVSMGKVDTRKFKKRADLLIFAAKHPGALTANFINALRQKLMRGGILRTSQLRDIEMTEFVTTGAAGLKEVRDRREAMTILQAMDHINQREVSKAMDVLAMRITALLEAKSSGGSWDKASRKELIPEEGSSLAPSGLTGLA